MGGGAVGGQAQRVREEGRRERARRPESLCKALHRDAAPLCRAPFGNSCQVLCVHCRSACLSLKVICFQACLGTYSLVPGKPQGPMLPSGSPSPFYQGVVPSSDPAGPVLGVTAVRPLSPAPNRSRATLVTQQPLDPRIKELWSFVNYHLVLCALVY